MSLKKVSGFSKKSKTEKINWLIQHYLVGNVMAREVLEQYWNENEKLQQLHDDFIENTLTNFYLPFGIAPNFLINDQLYAIPMVIEESSVVAAASNAAKFWLSRGGFKAEVISSQKNGQIHLKFLGKKETLQHYFDFIKPSLFESIEELQSNMKKRGGGLLSLSLKNKTQALEGYYHIHASFETQDAMGANFINSCLEQIAKTFEESALHFEAFKNEKQFPEVVMSILSNYVPECLVKASVSCPTEELSTQEIDGVTFAKKFINAVEIAQVEPRRAVTHNKGIMNGIDAVILATGNDFRAVEAGIHAYAAKEGQYKSLTTAGVKEGVFYFSIEIPLAIGTVGGLTSLHPLVKMALHILQNPSARELMKIVAVAGLAQNFAALRSLVTTGIQKGHMKMHLMNMLNQLEVSNQEREQTITYFENKTISYSAVENYIASLRSYY